ncbi:cytochrome C oxidase subunit II [Paenibacillus sp. GCM10012307]|uniref:Cytochrome C oxidase subunit II n=1 Tax=Paenibacillus roseus TaxID=2798579 RepID=A0A934IZA2_9BACL|nr:cytochrome C oxidase subunit II [Paenibacillus roseus]MBJ6359805.1 cytochrome C oxidase subunit II [Paenibacillus roseus]
MQKWIMFVFFAAASVLGLFLMTFGLPEKPVDESAGLAEGVTLLKLKASNYEFDQAEYKIEKGSKVKLLLQNTNGIHGVAIESMNVTLTKDNPSAEVEFNEPGTYPIHCSIPCGEGHLEMKAVIVVQ